MKIRLNFFDKALSDIMEIPEETGLRFRLALTQPLQVAVREIPQFPELNTVCEFEWSGYYDGGNTRNVRIYRLVDIRKM